MHPKQIALNLTYAEFEYLLSAHRMIEMRCEQEKKTGEIVGTKNALSVCRKLKEIAERLAFAKKQEN